MSEDVGAVPECEVMTLVTPNHSAFLVCSSGLGQAKIGLFFGMTLKWDAMRRRWFDVDPAGWVHSMVLHRCDC